MSKKDIILVGIALFTLCGCISGKIPKVVKSPAVRPQDILEEIAMPESGDTIRATARVSLRSTEGYYSRKMMFLLRMPSSLRVETIPLFGPADFFLSVNEESLKVFLPGDGKFYVGAATRENLSLFFKVLFTPSDMVSVLSGRPPHITGGDLSVRVEGGLHRVDIKSGKTVRSLWVDSDNRILKKIEEIEDGRTLWKAAFTDHVLVSGTSYPRGIQIEGGTLGEVTIDIRYLDLDTSYTGDTESFDLQVPPGITPIPVGR